jgi:hypothetical protein
MVLLDRSILSLNSAIPLLGAVAVSHLDETTSARNKQSQAVSLPPINYVSAETMDMLPKQVWFLQYFSNVSSSLMERSR